MFSYKNKENYHKLILLPHHISSTSFSVICKGIKNSASINSVNFTGCSLSWKGADSLAKVVKVRFCFTHSYLETSKRLSEANSADPDQTSHNMVSDQGLQCMLT